MVAEPSEARPQKHVEERWMVVGRRGVLPKSSGDIHLGSSLERRGDSSGPKSHHPIWMESLNDYLPEGCSRHLQTQVRSHGRTMDHSHEPAACTAEGGGWHASMCEMI